MTWKPGSTESGINVNDVWEIGGTYESFMGRWSRLVAGDFLQWLAVPAGSTWLDVGCGTGMLSRTILDSAHPALVRGIDPASGFIAFAADRIHDPRATFDVGTTDTLLSGPHIYDAVVSGLALNFIANGVGAISAMGRVTKPGGVIAAYVWDYAGRMQLLRFFWDAAAALDSAAAELDEGERFPLCCPERLRDLFLGQGLTRVEVRPIDVQTHFVDFQDYWTPFLSGQGPAPGYVASLSGEKQIALREQVRSSLPISPRGTIDLIARGWAVRGYS
jgi:SAM-dependent methyltransferase